ncbi:MAG: hypothetical protein ACR2QZ_16760 [Woeseiaceae bacterium]
MSPFRVIAAGTTWRWFGSRRAAETLLRAASGDDEQNRMLAGISLVKAGQRSFDLIEDKVEAGQANPLLVQLLSDIDSVRAREVLQKLAKGEPGEVTETARERIELLDRMDALEDEEP